MRKNIIILLFLITSPLISFGQLKVKWKKEISHSAKWQEVSSLGNLIMSTSDGLLAINSQTGDVLWNKKEHAKIARDNFEELPNSPFLLIENRSAFYLIDQISGKEIFNSKKAGIAKVKNYYLLYRSDNILVVGNDYKNKPVMLSIKMSDGSKNWSMDDEFGSVIAVNELENKELLIVAILNNYKLNANTGKVIWKNSNQPKMSKGVAAMAKLMAAAVNTDNIELNFYRKPNSDVFYIGTEQAKPMSSADVMTYKSVLRAFNISDGSEVWDKPLIVNGKSCKIVFKENGFIPLTDKDPSDIMRLKINLFDYKTKKGKWGKKGRGVKIKGGIYNYIEDKNGILLVTKNQFNDFLSYLDTKTGTLTYKNPIKIKGSVVGIVPLPKSLLYITTKTINILDQSTGKLKWKKGISTNPDYTAEYNNKIYAYTGNSIKIIDIATGTSKEIKANIGVINSFEVNKKGIFLSSEQSLAKVNFDGTLVYNESYPSPKEPTWKKALLYAEGLRAAVISAKAYYIEGALAKVERESAKTNKYISEKAAVIGNAYGDYGNYASGYAKQAFKIANARATATKSGNDFMFIMTQKDNKDIILLKVSKVTGKPEGEILLGKNKKPNYCVDAFTGQVYYLIGKKLTSYHVK